ncbi:hypothetical protein Gotri_020206 [Gossypium trilobum]|nr:hypothetical protein [Gossypium trilobum]
MLGYLSVHQLQSQLKRVLCRISFPLLMLMLVVRESESKTLGTNMKCRLGRNMICPC